MTELFSVVKKKKRVTYGLNGLLDKDRHTHINSEWRSAMCSFGRVWCGVRVITLYTILYMVALHTGSNFSFFLNENVYLTVLSDLCNNIKTKFTRLSVKEKIDLFLFLQIIIIIITWLSLLEKNICKTTFKKSVGK